MRSVRSTRGRLLAGALCASVLAGWGVLATRATPRPAIRPVAASSLERPPAELELPAAPRAREPRAPNGGRRGRDRRPSVALGSPSAGRLVRGVRLPAAGPHHLTWDPIHRSRPNRAWRRWGTDLLVRRVLGVARAYRRRHPDAPRVLVGDLSRPRGGDFGRRYGIVGHASHQNGLDVDVYLPRRDRRQRGPRGPGDVDRRLAQALVDRFVAAGAQYVFVGPSLGLRGPPGVVQPLAGHDDHLHVRLRGRPAAGARG